MSRNPVETFLQEEGTQSFKPSDAMKWAKAKVLTKLATSPFYDLKSASNEELFQLAEGKMQASWLANPSFMSWLRDGDEHKIKLEYLYGLALDAMEEMILSTDVKSQSARVKTISLLAELANKMPRRAEVSPGLSAIGNMDKVQLESFLEKSGYTVKQTFEMKRESKAIEAVVVPDTELNEFGLPREKEKSDGSKD